MVEGACGAYSSRRLRLWRASAQPAQGTQKPFEPVSGQGGKDVVWVPTPQVTVDKMLELAQVTARDYVIDLGSGNGITVITAAKMGATALGVEFNPDMVALAKRLAREAGVSHKATFVHGDLFETDLSKATVITLFLLPDLNLKLRPKLLDLEPGTRIRRTRSRWTTGNPTPKRPARAPVVHGTGLGGPGEGRWRMATRAAGADAHPAVPSDPGHAWLDADRGGQVERRRDHVHRRRPDIHRPRRREHHDRHRVVGEQEVAGQATRKPLVLTARRRRLPIPRRTGRGECGVCLMYSFAQREPPGATAASTGQR